MQHLDEGTIHAWLDGALAADEAGRVQRHAAECAECAPLVAEARGLIAGASRILSALDDVPAVVPGAGGGWRVAGSSSKGPPHADAVPVNAGATRHAPPATRRRPLWSRPATLAAAASVVLMVGMGIVWREGVRPTARGVVADTGFIPSLGEGGEGTAGGPGVGTASGAAPSTPTAGTSVAGGADTAAASQPGPRGGLPGGVAGGSARRREVATTERIPARRITGEAGRDARALRVESEIAAAPRPLTPAPAAQKGVAGAEKVAPNVPPAPAIAPEQRTRRGLAPSDSVHLADVVVTAVPEATGRRAAARRAAATRASSEQAVAAATGAAPPAQRVARADTVYEGRTDTVYRRGRRDTVFVRRPEAAANLRQPGDMASAVRPLPVTGCYEVVEGRLPRFITLTVDPVWSGAAEQRFAATAKGAIGYWSQPKRGDIHLVIARALVTARIDPSTGELRGTAQHGGTKERFVARRGCP